MSSAVWTNPVWGSHESVVVHGISETARESCLARDVCCLRESSLGYANSRCKIIRPCCVCELECNLEHGIVKSLHPCVSNKPAFMALLENMFEAALCWGDRVLAKRSPFGPQMCCFASHPLLEVRELCRLKIALHVSAAAINVLFYANFGLPGSFTFIFFFFFFLSLSLFNSSSNIKWHETCAVVAHSISLFSISFFPFSPWYNRKVRLGVKHQVTHLSLCVCLNFLFFPLQYAYCPTLCHCVCKAKNPNNIHFSMIQLASRQCKISYTVGLHQQQTCTAAMGMRS